MFETHKSAFHLLSAILVFSFSLLLDSEADADLNSFEGEVSIASIKDGLPSSEGGEAGTSGAFAKVKVGNPPTLTNLRATPSTVAVNGSSVLSWTSSGGEITEVSGIGLVPVGTAVGVRPMVSTDYLVTVSNDFGSVSRTVRVEVSGDLFDPEPAKFTSGDAYLWRPKMADLDGDGLNDFVAISLRPGAVSVLLWMRQSSPGVFEEATEISSQDPRALDVLPIDMDDDGDLDLVISGGITPRWLPNVINNPSEEVQFLAEREIFPEEPEFLGTQQFYVGHVNDDPYLDFVGGVESKLMVFYGIEGQRTGPGEVLESFDGNINAVILASGDLDGDGDVDFVSGLDFDGDIYWYENVGGRISTRHPVGLSDDRLIEAHIADTDNDGDLDILVRGDIGSGDQGDWTIFINPGDAQFSMNNRVRTDVPVSWAIQTAFLDYDEDGDIDFISWGGSDGLAISENIGSNRFRLRQAIAGDPFNELKGFDIGDLDNDGDLDLITANRFSAVIHKNVYSAFSPPEALVLSSDLSVVEDFTEERFALAGYFRDADSGTLQFSLQASEGGEVFESALVDDEGDLVLRSLKDETGSAKFIIQATNEAGLLAATELRVEILEQVDFKIEAVATSPVAVAPGANSHRLTLTNLGPSDATGVVIDLTRSLPPGVALESVGASTGEVVADQWLIDALAEGTSATLDLEFTIGADGEAGVENLISGGALAGVDQPLVNPGDDLATVASSLVSASRLGVEFVDPLPVLNRLTGLFSQKVKITNGNPLAISGWTYQIAGLADGVSLYHLTENGEGVWEADDDFAAGESRTYTFEFFDPSREFSESPDLLVESITVEDGDPKLPADSGEEAARVEILESGEVMIEFITQPGARYQVEYSHDMQTWIPANGSIVASATRTQWIDNGAPKTSSHPSDVPSRMYRIVSSSNE